MLNPFNFFYRVEPCTMFAIVPTSPRTATTTPAANRAAAARRSRGRARAANLFERTTKHAVGMRYCCATPNSAPFSASATPMFGTALDRTNAPPAVAAPSPRRCTSAGSPAAAPPPSSRHKALRVAYCTTGKVHKIRRRPRGS
eukprot:TRINITY_DN5318_c0_g1_i6.p2 TRINITY_DN5318_c0_g1~~TRINITY_DN5318_c0_g1_i6.p2  ORF type:complete len:143 (-),score=17.31 TRINITY_DN5318_c0_g1_i6:339-767(-)